jgi:hypothetical protein
MLTESIEPTTRSHLSLLRAGIHLLAFFAVIAFAPKAAEAQAGFPQGEAPSRKPTGETYGVSLGIQGWSNLEFGGAGPASLVGVALVGSYALNRHFALGAELELVDELDSERLYHCHDVRTGCFSGSTNVLGLAQVQTDFSVPINLFARGALGAGSVERTRAPGKDSQLEATARLSAGGTVTLGPVYASLFALLAVMAPHDMTRALGLELGGTF